METKKKISRELENDLTLLEKENIRLLKEIEEIKKRMKEKERLLEELAKNS